MMIEKSNIPEYRPITLSNLESSPYWLRIPENLREEIKVVGRVLPFRASTYVLEALIDWDKVPDDPIYRLVFHCGEMLAAEDYAQMRQAVKDADRARMQTLAGQIRFKLNPHPSGQMSHNVPVVKQEKLPGIQWKYADTVLFFPSPGQVCHAYCTFCFRWAQFVGDETLKFQAREVSGLLELLRAHPEISDVLLTGGDPLVMKSAVLARYIDPLLSADLESFRTLRIGTKSLTYWPRRFVTDADADDLLRLFERVVQSGRHLALMMHLNHPTELSTPLVREAIRRIQRTGAVLRFQGPLIRSINDDAETWRRLCSEAVKLGIVPYYMFVERDTGPKHFFEVPLYRAAQIFAQTCRSVSGLASTLRGPTMSASQGKVIIDGVITQGTRKAFALRYLRARNPAWTHQPFFAEYSETATWFDQLRPLNEQDAHFFDRLEGARALETAEAHAATRLSQGVALRGEEALHNQQGSHNEVGSRNEEDSRNEAGSRKDSLSEEVLVTL